VIIIASSFVGSYGIVRGISLFIPDTFPNEFELAKAIKAHEITFKDFPKIYYAYLGGIVVLSIATSVFQCKKMTNE